MRPRPMRRRSIGRRPVAVNVNSVLITGTTSGVGRGLLQHYAKREVKVISVNRRRVAELEAQYPSVRFECLDVRSAESVEGLLRELEASGELPDVFILNAGINRLDNDEAFDLSLS
jgi:NADP-dependent 3-hydroxy acid dehydrogenase YdfG